MKTDSKPTTDLRKKWIFSVLILLTLLIILFLVWPAKRKPIVPIGMLPAEAHVVVLALGPTGLYRVIQVISPNDLPSEVSGGTHMMSGMYHGKPYGLAFDIAIIDPLTADSDVHKLRMQGIAAWRRGPGAPGGGENLGPHIHCVWLGARTRNVQNREQVSSFVHGYKGVVEKDENPKNWRDTSITRPEIGRVRSVYEGIYGKGSLARIPLYETRHRSAFVINRTVMQ